MYMEEKVKNLIKDSIKKEFPWISEKDLNKYLSKQKQEYFFLTPHEYSQLDNDSVYTIIENFYNDPYGELLLD